MPKNLKLQAAHAFLRPAKLTIKASMAAKTAFNAGAFSGMNNRSQLYHEFAVKVNEEFAELTGQVADAEAVKSRIKKLKETAEIARRSVWRKTWGPWGWRWLGGVGCSAWQAGQCCWKRCNGVVHLVWVSRQTGRGPAH